MPVYTDPRLRPVIDPVVAQALQGGSSIKAVPSPEP